MKGLFILFTLITSIQLSGQGFKLSGYISNRDGDKLEFATVFLKGTNFGAVADQKGFYEILNIPAGEYMIEVAFLGYESLSRRITIQKDMRMDFRMEGSVFNLEEIEIKGTWVKKNMPFSHKNLEKQDFEQLNLGQDVPYLLKFTPSMVVTSDAGAGVGYTGMRIRGSDPSRINVTINGVPLNDSESQLVFWVDLPDFASSAQEIQIQRGVGPSTNGTSAFGATINLNTNNIRLKPYLNLSTGYGSFNTSKINVSGGTGLMNNKLSVDLRYSAIKSDGYVNRATSDLSSFYGSLNYISENSSLNFNVISGQERTYQAWNGLPIQFLDEKRRFNVSGTEKPGSPYADEVDNYGQHHFQLHYNRALNTQTTINITGHYTRGLGYFENYRAGQDLNSYDIPDESGESHDVVIRRWLDNHFYGTVMELDWKDYGERQNFTFALSANQYRGDHFGHVIWNSRDFDDIETLEQPYGPVTTYYFNDAVKTEFNTYGKYSHLFGNRLVAYMDLQYRMVNYVFQGYDDRGFLVNQEDRLHFFNPKAGLSYLLNNESKLYLSYSVANREPNRNDYTESSTLSRPEPEQLYDLELGYTIQSDQFGATINFYNMSYRNQLVLTGAINDVGEYTRTNVDRSYRRGLEIDGGLYDWKGFHFLVNATLSRNRILSFTEFIDDWDTGGQIEQFHGLTNLAFSPSVIMANDIGMQLLRKNDHHDANISLITKYVGRQFIDNTSNNNAALDAYYYSDLLMSYTLLGNKWFKQIRFNLNIHNLTNNLYVSNAWVYRFQSLGYNPVPDDPYARSEGQGIYNLTGLYPQAGRYFLAGITFSF